MLSFVGPLHIKPFEGAVALSMLQFSWPFINSSYQLFAYPSDYAYLVQRVSVGFIADAQVMFELAQGPHAGPAVFLTDRQQQRGDGVVELRNRHWIPGAQEHDVCNHTHNNTELNVLQNHYIIV